ncbi:hypothetical protein D3C81_1550430 [compost metagenome]
MIKPKLEDLSMYNIFGTGTVDPVPGTNLIFGCQSNIHSCWKIIQNIVMGYKIACFDRSLY